MMIFQPAMLVYRRVSLWSNKNKKLKSLHPNQLRRRYDFIFCANIVGEESNDSSGPTGGLEEWVFFWMGFVTREVKGEKCWNFWFHSFCSTRFELRLTFFLAYIVFNKMTCNFFPPNCVCKSAVSHCVNQAPWEMPCRHWRLAEKRAPGCGCLGYLLGMT